MTEREISRIRNDDLLDTSIVLITMPSLIDEVDFSTGEILIVSGVTLH
ncbi:MAG: hypothetical protein PF569_02060 [Candidatus Woesearchaeota archaeon]|jgi:hypothetical protein|nr:hypothetical protein [Candidatus Woesearchaeota archaeon]